MISTHILILINLFGCGQSNVNVLNEGASVLALNELPENPLLLHPLSSSINPNNNTMATLYGNDLAMDHVHANNDYDYPAGTILYEVIWKQKPDSLWFGGNIPGEVLSVEQIVFNDKIKPTYKLYKGNGLQVKQRAKDTLERVKLIISQRLAVSP